MADRITIPRRRVYYPMSDGKPLADNTLQFDWIIKLFNGLSVQYADVENVFIASNLIWYPVEGRPRIRTAPDVMVAFDRPKGYRSSYLQWQEDGVTPHVVFEIRSPRNLPAQLQRLFEFYEHYGVEEYYFYDPYQFVLSAWRRSGKRFKPVRRVQGWRSPRLNIRFEIAPDGLHVFAANGREFLLPDEEAKRQSAALERLRQESSEARARYDALLEQLRERGIDTSDLP
jgi:Uma2 family endonuclease